MFLVTIKKYREYLQNHIFTITGFLFLLYGIFFYSIMFHKKMSYVLSCIIEFLLHIYGYNKYLLSISVIALVLFWLLLFFLGTLSFSFCIIALLRPSVSLKNRTYLKSFIDVSLCTKLFYISLIQLFLSVLIIFFSLRTCFYFPLYAGLFFCSKMFFDIFLVWSLDHKTDSFFSIFKKTVLFVSYQLPFLTLFSVLRSLLFFPAVVLLSSFYFGSCINSAFFVLYTLLIDPFFMAFLLVFYTKRVHEQITLYT